jgi:hypothetical protein
LQVHCFLIYFELICTMHLCSFSLILLIFSQSQYIKLQRAFHFKY